MPEPRRLPIAPARLPGIDLPVPLALPGRPAGAVCAAGGPGPIAGQPCAGAPVERTVDAAPRPG